MLVSLSFMQRLMDEGDGKESRRALAGFDQHLAARHLSQVTVRGEARHLRLGQLRHHLIEARRLRR